MNKHATSPILHLLDKQGLIKKLINSTDHLTPIKNSSTESNGGF